MVVVGESGTGLKPSMRVVGAADVTIGFKSIDGGVCCGGTADDELATLVAGGPDVEARATAEAGGERLVGLAW